MKILLINGPNLNFLGIRNIKQYGSISYENMIVSLKEKCEKLDIDLITYQSNHEGDIIDKLQSYYNKVDGIVINAGAFTHYSYAIRDCLEMFNCIKVEVHISNINKREEFRKHSVISEVCDASCCGFGIKGYEYAFDYVKESFLNEK